MCVSCASQSTTVLKISGSRTLRETAWVHSIPHLARPWIVADILYISHIPTAGLDLLTDKQPVRHALASFRHCTNYAIHLVQLHVSWARRRSTPGLCGLCGYLFGPPGALGVINIRLWRHLYHSHTIYLRAPPRHLSNWAHSDRSFIKGIVSQAGTVRVPPPFIELGAQRPLL
jgi:hypothetical protein